MKKTILLYGLLGGVLIAGLKLIEYRFLVIEHSIEIYGGIVALLFSALGIGQARASRPREREGRASHMLPRLRGPADVTS